MKYLWVWIALLAVILTGVVPAAAGVPTFETRLNEILVRTSEVIDYLISQDYLIERIDVDLVLAEHNFISIHQCYDFYTHKIIGIGETGIVKLDGYILDSDGNTLDYDDEWDAIPLLSFIPKRTEEYRFMFEWAETAEGYPDDHLGYVAIVYAVQPLN